MKQAPHISVSRAGASRQLPRRGRCRGLRRFRGRGYALVLVLLVLVIAGTALAAAARLSLGRALDALRAEEEL